MSALAVMMVIFAQDILCMNRILIANTMLNAMIQYLDVLNWQTWLKDMLQKSRNVELNMN